MAADKNSKEEEKQFAKWTAKEVYLRISVNPGAVCNFSYSADENLLKKYPAPSPLNLVNG
jgi:hypothetical protein